MNCCLILHLLFPSFVSLDTYVMLTTKSLNEINLQVIVVNVFLLVILKGRMVWNFMILKSLIILYLGMFNFMRMNFLLLKPMFWPHLLHTLSPPTLIIWMLIFYISLLVILVVPTACTFTLLLILVMRLLVRYLLSNLRMGELPGSFPKCALVRPKCAEKTCVVLWDQFIVSMSSNRWFKGPGCYKGRWC